MSNTSKEIILHIGHPKTGTTTLQKTFQQSVRTLGKYGILYPTQGRQYSHKLLIPLWLHRSAQDSIGRTDLGTLEQQVDRAQKAWSGINRKLAEPNLRQLVLSSEHLYSWTTQKNVGFLREALDLIDADRRVVAYIREPSAAFLSNVQQHIKKSGTIRIPRRNRIQHLLTLMETAGIGQINACKFQREAFRNGNIVDDFCGRFLPSLPVAELTVAEDAKTSLSPEAMSLMQAYYRDDPELRFLGKLGRTRMVEFIEHFDRKIEGFSRPALHPHVRDSYQAYVTDYEWLAENHQIEFPEARPAVKLKENPEAALSSISNVSDLCPVNAGRLERLKRDICRARASYNRASIELREIRNKISKQF